MVRVLSVALFKSELPWPVRRLRRHRLDESRHPPIMAGQGDKAICVAVMLRAA
jgi:hypothetical protein